MGSIKAKYSSVELFFDKCSTEYPIVLNIANEVLRQVEQMLYEAERDKQKLRSQIIKLKAMQDGLSSKSMRCSAMISEAQSECQRYSREMEYIQNHPIPTTKTDSDGNEYTEMVVDEAAYRAASRSQMEASSMLSLQMSKQYDIEEVGDRIKDKIEDFEWTYKGIELIIKNLETCVYEIKKTISAMEYEADYNNTKFREVLEALSAYLASKPIFMPSNAVYDVFANENITSASNDESSSSRVSSSMHDALHNANLFNENEAGDYTYTDSESGKSASGVLKKTNEPIRDSKAQRNAGGEYRRNDDDGGHLIGARYGGAPDEKNLDAQNSNLNRGSYKHREDSWEQSMEDGDKVYVHIETSKSNGSQRPDAYMGYSITEHSDGTREWDAFSFQNESKQTQEQWNKELAEFDAENPENYNNPMDEIYQKENYKNEE